MAEGRRGRPVLGFFGGLLLGLGLAVALQQAAIWPLDVWSVFVAPLVLAVIGILLGRAAPFGGRA